jgi:hypothetical protein
MAISVSRLQATVRAEWEILYHGYAEFYQVPINDQILDTGAICRLVCLFLEIAAGHITIAKTTGK